MVRINTYRGMDLKALAVIAMHDKQLMVEAYKLDKMLIVFSYVTFLHIGTKST